MITINDYNVLTDNYILNIDDTLFIGTQAYRTFSNKQRFIHVIKDNYIRFKLMKDIMQFIP